jgi:hypothetical protein
MLPLEREEYMIEILLAFAIIFKASVEKENWFLITIVAIDVVVICLSISAKKLK